MSFSGLLKHNAKLAMHGRWGAGALILFVTGVVSLVLAGLEYTAIDLFVLPPAVDNPTMEPFDFAAFTRELLAFAQVEIFITVIITLLSVIFLSPLSLGVSRWYYELAQGKGPTVGVIFRYFESIRQFGRAIRFNISLAVRTWLWSLLFYILPSLILNICVFFLTRSDYERRVISIAGVGLLLSIALFVLSGILYAIFIQRYAIAAYLLCEQDDVRVRAAISSSVRFTKGYRGNLFSFRLSFIGWFLLVPLTLGLILFFLVPYFNASMALYARYLAEKGRGGQSESTHEFTPPTTG